jgi:3-isopropylmalate/(R)-2-methylmalate dehydratase small subunit
MRQLARARAVGALRLRFRALIAPSYADIFLNNCYKNGLLPIVLTEGEVDRLFADTLAFPGFKLVVDLDKQVVSTPDGSLAYSFDIEPYRKHRLLNGLDDIALTLQHAEAIREFENKRLAQQPWLA